MSALIRQSIVYVLAVSVGFYAGWIAHAPAKQQNGQNREQRTNFKTGPPNPAWVDANEKEKQQ